MRARFAKDAHHPSQRRVNSGAHIQRLNRKPRDIDPDHLTSSRSTTAHSRAADTGHSTLTVLDPRHTSIRIIAADGAAPEIATGKNPPPLSIEGDCSDAADTATGIVAARSASTTQRRNRFAFSERDSATAAIETPARRHAATDSALNAALWRRRRRRPQLSAWSKACTCPPKY